MKVGTHKKSVIALWVVLIASVSFGVYKNFTAIDQHTTHEIETIQLRLNDTNGIENFVKNFAKSYYTWSNSKEAIEARTQAVSYTHLDVYKRQNQLNIIQVADLVLPDKDTTFEEYTTIELLSVAMLIVISTFALDFIHSDRSIFKIVDLDEAWAFLNVAQGETLSNKLVRAGPVSYTHLR